MQINIIEIVVAAIVSMIVGFIYYSPSVLGKPWMKAMGLTSEKLKKAQKEMGKLYGVSFVLSLLSAYVLSHVMTLSMNYYVYSALTTGLTTGFWMWLGFIMPVQLTSEIFGSKNWNLFMINTGYQLISLMLMGVAIALL